MLYQRLQRKRVLRLCLLMLAVALFSVVTQLLFSQGSMAAGSILFEAKPPQTPPVLVISSPSGQTSQGERPVSNDEISDDAQSDGAQGNEPDPGTGPSAELPPAPEPEEQKPYRIALTFDDGPGAFTGRLLDELKQRDVKATFFVLGSRVPGNEELIARMVNEGHEVGNHSYSHPIFKKMNQAAISQEITRAADLIEQAGGVRPWLVRPPYGDVSSPVKAALSEPLILWSVDPLDWKLRDTDAVVKAVLSTVRDGDIVLLHDIYSTTVDAALIVIDRLSEEGYDFVTVSELFEETGKPLQSNMRYNRADPRVQSAPEEKSQAQ